MSHRKMFVQWMCAVTALVGVAVLMGWALDLEVAKSVVPGFVAMNPVTAVCFLLSATALWLLNDTDLRKRYRRVGQCAAGLVIAVGIACLAGYFWPSFSGADQWLFSALLQGNRMAPNTCVLFVLLGASWLLLDYKGPRGRYVSQWTLGGVLLGGTFAVIGYAINSSQLYGVTSFIPMALHTGLLFTCLAAGGLAARPDRPLIQILTSPGPGGIMVRRLLPVIVLAHPVIGWLRWHGELAGFYDSGFGVSLMVAFNILLLAAVAFATARRLDQLDQQRRQAQIELQQAHDQLVHRVEERTAELRNANECLNLEIAERRRAEEAVRSSAGTVERLNADLKIQLEHLARANRALAEKNKENETFVYSVSHDLRSPLVNLQGFSDELHEAMREIEQLLDAPEVPQAVRESAGLVVREQIAPSLHFIQTAVRRLAHIIDALLQLSRAGRVEYQFQQVDMNRLIGNTVDAMSATLAERSARVDVDDLPTAWGDPTALEQLFANLIGNAVKYAHPDRLPVIQVGCLSPNDVESRPSTTCYFVRDNGLGIDPNYWARVFEAFKRCHPMAAQEGEGMGLAIVRRIAERHGGRVWVESTPNEGSTFFVRLPSDETAMRDEEPLSEGFRTSNLEYVDVQ